MPDSTNAIPVPANAAANDAARKLLAFFHSLPGRADRCVLSGHFVRWNHNASLDEITSIHAKTGQWVAIASGDYYTNDQKQAHPINYRRTNDVLLEYARARGLVTLSVHTNNPVTGGPAWDSKCELGEVITPGTAANRNWMGQLGQIADGLEELRRAGVVVLFRPFHEMTGGWFWWGGKDAEAFKTLWCNTFDYLSRDRKLDHLLWVYTPSAGVGDMLSYYPGGQYVDLVGFDAYTPDPATLREKYEQLLTTGKPFGFGEYGPVSGNVTAGDVAPYDWTTFAHALKDHLPRACYFVTWRDHWGLDHHQNPGALLNDPRIINRDQFPARAGQSMGR